MYAVKYKVGFKNNTQAFMFEKLWASQYIFQMHCIVTVKIAAEECAYNVWQ